MSDLTATPAHRAARNAASIELADTGAGVSSIRLYTAQGGALLATRRLQKPCGQIRLVDGGIEILQATDPDLISATGSATWFEWHNAAGDPISGGSVTDENGMITVAGVPEPAPGGLGAVILAGASGTQLHAGGVLQLDGLIFG